MIKKLRLNKKILMLFFAFLAGMETCLADDSDPIAFADANVKAICVANWDTNNDGELSYAEAAAVTSISTLFKGKTNILSFNELQHFTSLTAIDERAFMGCTSLAEITIPENIATIGDKAFVNCPALATVHFNAINCTSMNTVYSGENYSVFMSNQTTFPLANLTIGSNVQNIPDGAFRGCNHIQNLIIPASVTTIGEYAFFGCSNLETLTIGEGVTSIGNYAFWSCPSLLTVHFNATNCTSMGWYDAEWWQEYGTWRLECVYYSVFKSGNSSDSASPIATLTIGDNVTRIPDCAFCGCTGLSGSLNIPNSVTSIGAYAFQGCTGFTGNLILGNSITDIGAGAFMGCSGFIGDLVIPNSVILIQGIMLSPGAGLEEFRIYHGAFWGCSGFTGNLTLSNSLTIIEDGAFWGCSGFTGSLIIPNSVTYIGDEAFCACSGFTGSLTISNSVHNIGEGAFASCSGFTGNLVIPNSLGVIGYDAFSGCGNFDGVLIIGRSVTDICDGAFSGCSGFTAVVLETSTMPLPEIRLGNWGPSSYFDGVFSGMNSNIPVYVPAGQISDYQNDEQGQWSYFTNYVNQVKFETDSNNQWSDDFNWSSWVVPTSEDVVCIADNCQLDMDADVLFLYVLDDEDVLTINSGKTFTSTYGVDTQSASQMIIEDGGQLVCNNAVTATLKKNVNAWNESDGTGWYTISSPIGEVGFDDLDIANLTPTNGTDRLYDIFRYNESSMLWENSIESNYNSFENGRGYLYRKGNSEALSFTGTINVDESYKQELTVTGETEIKGFALLGNPYSHNITLKHITAEGNSLDECYVLSGEGAWTTKLTEADNDAIKPCQGFLVQATVEGDAYIHKTAQRSTRTNSDYIMFTIANGQYEDVTYALFKEGQGLNKIDHRNANIQKVYIPKDGENFAVATMADNTQSFNLNFEAKTMGQFTLSYKTKGEFNYLHVIDRMTGKDIDMLLEDEYKFISSPQDAANRFIVRLGYLPNYEDNGENIFAYQNGSDIIVSGEGDLQIFDVLGRKVITKQINGVQSISAMPAGVYILKLIENDMKTQKIVVR